MPARAVLVAFCFALTLIIAHFAVAQSADPEVTAACQGEFVKLRDELEKRGLAVKAAGEKKADAKEGCALLRRYTAAEQQLIKFFTEKQAVCGIPPEVAAQAKQAFVKSGMIRDQVCKVAAGGGGPGQGAAPSAPAPSQGLSGALGTSTVGAPPAGTTSGGGVFDTLTGNVLQR